jgi:hypothetical protein
VDPNDPMAIVESELPPVRAIPAVLPTDLESISVTRLIAVTKSMGRLNAQLVDAFNAVVGAVQQYGEAVTMIVAEYAALAERLEAEEEAAAEQASESSAAADWPGDTYLDGPTTVGGAIREGLQAQARGQF